MPAVSDKLARAAWRLTPAPIERKLRTEAGKRFLRFVPVSVAAVITSQVVLAILTGPVNIGGFKAGVVASMVAAAVSYVLSRWAWERKGKPDLLRETLPFWAVSIFVWIILGLTTKYANEWAHSMGMHHLERHLVVNGAYFVMNCLTFICRFLIFHYVLFTDRTPRGAHAADQPYASPGAVNSVAAADAASGVNAAGVNAVSGADGVARDLNGSSGPLTRDTSGHPRVPS
jgi:putative flippase GtrA